MRADYVVTAVRTGGAGAAGVSLLVVEKGTPGFEVTRRLDKMGWRSSDTAELSYTDVRVPAANLVGAENSGFAADRAGVRLRTHRPCRPGLFERATLPGPDRAVVPGPRDVRQAADLAAVGAEHAGRDGPAHRCRAGVLPPCRGTPAGTGTADLITEVCFAKNTAVEAGEWVANQAVQLFGGMGYMTESEVERQYRDMRILGIGGGTTEILTGPGRQDTWISGMTATVSSTLDPKLADISPRRREAMTAKLAEIDAELAKALAGGGAKYVERHHDRGKLTARERIELLRRPGLAVPGVVPAGRLRQRLPGRAPAW